MGHRLSGDEEDGADASSLRADGSKLLQQIYLLEAKLRTVCSFWSPGAEDWPRANEMQAQSGSPPKRRVRKIPPGKPTWCRESTEIHEVAGI